MPTNLRIFDVPASTQEEPKPRATARAELVSLDQVGDAARSAAKKNLQEMGLTVRSLNWAPTPNGQPELVAYVTRRV